MSSFAFPRFKRNEKRKRDQRRTFAKPIVRLDEGFLDIRNCSIRSVQAMGCLESKSRFGGQLDLLPSLLPPLPCPPLSRPINSLRLLTCCLCEIPSQFRPDLQPLPVNSSLVGQPSSSCSSFVLLLGLVLLIAHLFRHLALVLRGGGGHDEREEEE